MPGFDSLNNPPALYQGDSHLTWNAESPAVGSFSQEVAVAMIPGASGGSISVELSFSGAPGAFEVDLMTSDTDNLSDYVQRGKLVAVDANNVARLELTGLVANFAALQLVALANVVTVTAKITSK